MPNPMPLDEWIGAVAKLAGYDNGAELVADTGTCCWMDFYNDGLTPAQAYAEDCDNA